MISFSKFQTLAATSQVRKVQRWIHVLLHLRTNVDAAMPDLPTLATCILAGTTSTGWAGLLSPGLLEELATLATTMAVPGAFLDPRHLHRIGLLFNRDLGTEAAEWDLEPSKRVPIGKPPGLMAYAEDLRSPFNVGSIFRTAEAFGFSRIILSEASPRPGLSPRLEKSAMGACTRIDWQVATLDQFLAEWPELPVFALELGGTMVENFTFPDHGLVILGSEELGVHPQTLELCRARSGIVSIGLQGTKASLNVGVSFGILAETWTRTVKN